jgi:hypothetical protein
MDFDSYDTELLNCRTQETLRIFPPCVQEYLNFKGSKFSKSRGAAVDVPYFLSMYDPDPLRFYLTATAPETRDTEFSWEDFVERNNNELVATWGNLANRMLSFAYKRFNGVVPEPGAPSSPSGQSLDEEDCALLEKVEAGFETVGDLYNACKFRAALGEALALAREANGYLDRKAPWFQIKEDPPSGGDDGVRYPARGGQPEDDPGTDPAPHGAATPRVPGLRRAAIWHPACGRVPGGNAQPRGADLRSRRGGGDVGGECAAGGADPA